MQNSHETGETLHNINALKKFSRRNFLRLIGIGAIGVADKTYGDEIRKQRASVDIKSFDDPEVQERFPDTSWLILPGLKTSWEETDLIARALEPVMKERGQIARLGYSNEGLDIYELYDHIANYTRTKNITTLHLYGHSFGGMVAVEIAALLERDESMETTVDLIVLDSSPSSKYDVIDQRLFTGLAQSQQYHYEMPTAVRAGYELGERIVNKNERSWPQVFQQTTEQLLPQAPSNRLVQSQIDYIYRYDGRRFSNALSPGTRVALIANNNDATVRPDTAQRGWRSNLPNNYLMNVYHTRGALPAHASPQWNPSIYQSELKEIQHYLLPLDDNSLQARTDYQ